MPDEAAHIGDLMCTSDLIQSPNLWPKLTESPNRDGGGVRMPLRRWHPHRTALSRSAVGVNTGVAEASGTWHRHTSRADPVPRAPPSTQPPSRTGDEPEAPLA